MKDRQKEFLMNLINPNKELRGKMVKYAKYIEYVRKQPCIVCGTKPVDADHLETIGMGNNRKRRGPKDLTCIPLCRKHHQERHHLGNSRFEAKYIINLWREAFNTLRRYILERAKTVR